MTTKPRGVTLPSYTFALVSESAAFVGISPDGAYTNKAAYGLSGTGTAPYNNAPPTAVAPITVTHRGQDAVAGFASSGGDIVMSPGVGSVNNPSGNLIIKDTSGKTGWNTAHLLLGTFHIWPTADGQLRGKNSPPTSDQDGVSVSVPVYVDWYSATNFL